MIDEDVVTHGGRLHGTAYTEDADYMRIWGPQREAIIYDWTIRQYRRCKMQCLLTPRDAVTPADPDVHLQEEQLFRDDESPFSGAW